MFFAYLCVSAFYTLFSKDTDEWSALSYFINYSFFGVSAFYCLPKSILRTIIISYSIARTIVSIYCLYDSSICKNIAVNTCIVLTISISFIWTWRD